MKSSEGGELSLYHHCGHETTFSSARRGDVPDLTADPSLAEKELSFKALENLETMCRDLWNWQTKNPMGYGELL
jgi:UDP-glucose 4-epimerase